MPKKKNLTKEEMRARRLELSEMAANGELRFPKAIVEMRLSLGMTQEIFAKRFGITRTQLVRIEAGKANPTFETMNKIARPFGLTVGLVPREY